MPVFTLNVYVWALTIVKFDTAPFITVSPAAVNPVTSSLNVTVNGTEARLVGFGATVVMAAVGAVVSITKWNPEDAVLTLPAASVAVAVIVYVPFARAELGVNVQAPTKLATTVPSCTGPEPLLAKIVTVEFAAAVPVI